MARYQCRACGFDSQAPWAGELTCPRCGSRTAVRAAMRAEELTDAEIAAIAKAEVPAEHAHLDEVIKDWNP